MKFINLWWTAFNSETKRMGNAVETQNKMKLRGILSEQLLRDQNQEFADTAGVSAGNRDRDFVPAFQNTRNGECVVSRFADGSDAPIHVLDGLPRQWITSVDENGHVTAVDEAVVAGFLHSGRFYTREEAAEAR
ncbi:MAG TPA: hypothetical protein PLZ16_00300 [Gammaproteobacteria bacterium]|nr:hypothetical protein [Gammaproteobacteria bacterium]